MLECNWVRLLQEYPFWSRCLFGFSQHPWEVTAPANLLSQLTSVICSPWKMSSGVSLTELSHQERLGTYVSLGHHPKICMWSRFIDHCSRSAKFLMGDFTLPFGPIGISLALLVYEQVSFASWFLLSKFSWTKSELLLDQQGTIDALSCTCSVTVFT